MGKSTISMAMFHCYVSSPEGIHLCTHGLQFLCQQWVDLRRLRELTGQVISGGSWQQAEVMSGEGKISILSDLQYLQPMKYPQ